MACRALPGRCEPSVRTLPTLCPPLPLVCKVEACPVLSPRVSHRLALPWAVRLSS